MKKIKQITVKQFWKKYDEKYNHISKTLVELEDGKIDFAYVMPKFKSFDHHRQGASFSSENPIIKIIIYEI